MIEDQIDELVADNAEKNLRIYALEDLLAFFSSSHNEYTEASTSSLLRIHT
ncbi:hypothetical protein CGSHi22421_00702 [Haemophilus influenzae R3021]|uniref:Uncharacterized protein n=1 Tax=Haemophilus influenzae R3021 TaxID=375432 RepID=A4N6Y5_HAEIF|nr:hypothetical protein CGSHi22421_00702 [Haemophilus influenzae R3021]